MSITYFATDKHGHTYSRHSAGHTVPRYFWVNISRPAGSTDRGHQVRRDLFGQERAEGEPVHATSV